MEKIKIPQQRSACHRLGLFLSAILGELILFFTLYPYPTGRVLMVILAGPLAVNLLLMRSQEPLKPLQELPPLKENARRLTRILRRVRSFLRRWTWAFLSLCSRHFHICNALLGSLFLLFLHLWFWRKKTPYFLHPVSIYIPMVLAAGFFLLLVLEIWCRHLIRDSQDPEGRFCSILKNLHSEIRMDKFLFLGATAAAAMPMLKLPQFYRQYYWILCWYLGLQTGFLVLFYCIRAAKGELLTHPDLRLLVLHRKKGDLSLVAYLEENTGITMRSLWSISLVKKLLPYTAFTAVLILWLSTGIVQIAPNQHGALYRLGRLSDQALDPGIHLILPWPVDKVEVRNTETLKEITIGYTTDEEKGDNLWTESHGGEENKLLLGGGNELVSINLRIEFKISDLCSYLKCASSPESLLESAAYEAVTARTISTNLQSLLDLDRMAFSRSFEQELNQRLSRYDTGLQVVDVVIESIHPPIEVAEIYQQIISAGIDAERILLDAQARANVAIEEARLSRDTDINTAQASSHESIAAANASVAQFLAGVDAYESYGGNYRYYKYLEALKKAYQDSTLVIVGEGVDSSHLYLGKLPS